MRVLNTRTVRAMRFDRDGTLVHDEPCNGDPRRVRLRQDADRSMARLRSADLRSGRAG